MVEDWLQRAARERPDHPALETPEGTLSFAELDAAASRSARRLAALGVAEGDHVATTLAPGADFAALLHGAPRLGAALMALDPRGQHGADVAVSEPLRGAEADVRLRPAMDPAAVHTVVYTSGSTGRAKAVELTVANHFASATAWNAALGIRPDDRWLCAMPLFHVGGLAILLRSAVGATTVRLHETFDAARVRAELESGEVTLVSLVPTMLHRLREEGLGATPAVRAILLGGGPVPAELLSWARSEDLPVMPTYGMSETASGVAMAPARSDPARAVPLTGVEVAVSSEGEVLVRGPMVARGEIGAGGWLHTGDLGRLDEEGRLTIAGRIKDVIVTGGENVLTSRVEDALTGHPAVAEAAAAGLPDEEWGERVVAFVVLDAAADAGALIDHARARLAPHEVPKEVHVVASLPRNAAGKLLREQLRAGPSGPRATRSDRQAGNPGSPSDMNPP